MESVANSIQLPPLDSLHEREAVTNELQLVLQDLINLSLIGKQLHWAVVGSASHSLHLFIDELVQSWRELADLVAERAVTLGSVPDGQAATVAQGSQLGPVPVRSLDDQVVVWELARRVAAAAEQVRRRLLPIGEADLVTQEVLVEVVRTLEKHQWLLRAQLGGMV
jgi:starvation-inducible DNA-binding protein